MDFPTRGRFDNEEVGLACSHFSSSSYDICLLLVLPELSLSEGRTQNISGYCKIQ